MGDDCLKRKRVIISLCVIVILVAATFGIFLTHTFYVIPANICEALFSCSPNEFYSTSQKFSWTEDFCVYSQVDKNGNLILILNENQKSEWRQYHADFFGHIKNRNIEISPDYSCVTVSSYYETALADVNCAILNMQGFAANQLLDGVAPADIGVKFILTDAGTQEILYTATWPSEAIHIDFDKHTFSHTEIS